jgi:hypothetical protein
MLQLCSSSHYLRFRISFVGMAYVFDMCRICLSHRYVNPQNRCVYEMAEISAWLGAYTGGGHAPSRHNFPELLSKKWHTDLGCINIYCSRKCLRTCTEYLVGIAHFVRAVRWQNLRGDDIHFLGIWGLKVNNSVGYLSTISVSFTGKYVCKYASLMRWQLVSDGHYERLQLAMKLCFRN